MATNPKQSNLAVTTGADAVCDLLDDGYLRIYSGTQPTTADTAIGAQVLLAELRWNATAFPAATNGVATANAITSDASANATGTAAWFRALKSDGTTVVFDGSVGTADADLIIATTSIVAAATIPMTSFTYTFPKG
jgi:hypothetical protein